MATAAFVLSLIALGVALATAYFCWVKFQQAFTYIEGLVNPPDAEPDTQPVEDEGDLGVGEPSETVLVELAEAVTEESTEPQVETQGETVDTTEAVVVESEEAPQVTAAQGVTIVDEEQGITREA